MQGTRFLRVKDDFPVEAVRQVCESFQGAIFTLVDAARRMVQMHPSAPTQVFADGWEALLLSGELANPHGNPSKYHLIKICTVKTDSPLQGKLRKALTEQGVTQSM